MKWLKAKRAGNSGDQAENLAMRFLRNQGLKLLDRNIRSTYGEIDLVMSDAGTVVFIEVRLRTNQRYQSAAESVVHSKQAKLWATAQHYLQKENLADKVPCRFDVVALNSLDKNASIDWIRNAFNL
ncbi:YraN family protein [Gilvimarinus sp. SDUM040013]|uniref:UPF0102 protein SCD92_01195 n=1 Tax=Gilvimarinus gilvus TaxID=3058038 RepID=A0ABU4RW80_9GAMM|nr:YraN family protein [Gilvimarinus sp. SDUM040013]MDO3388403.1 YraN family protein [Gilvimarinus sp. SDUM040013]MDX6847953.1 YraN family protein [Gilvimarinus sp. SDUM040013]